MSLFEIVNRWTGKTIFCVETVSLRFAVESAIKGKANLSGVDLSEANLSEANLSEANLSEANLSEANLSGADLRGADLRGVDLSGADLSWANLSEADLSGVDLSGANLRGADLSGVDLNIPVVENLENKILVAVKSGDTLEMTSWHRCHTTHCRAGWAIHLAGASGYALEKRVGSSAAGALIYHASVGYVPNFYASNAEAFADIQSHATSGIEEKQLTA